MHRSKVPLTHWFWAAHLIATHFEQASVRRLQALLHLSYQAAWRIKEKFRISLNNELLEGLVEINYTQIQLHDDHHIPFKLIVAVAMSSLEIRLAIIPDSSAPSIEDFVRRNVKAGSTLITEAPLYFSDYKQNLQPAGVPRRTSMTFDLLRESPRLLGEPVDRYLARFVIHHNDCYRQISFHRVLEIALRQKPRSYWDIIGRVNPRKGALTVRLQPRRRKTGIGVMRQDGSGAS
jgi:hypothetical protein